MPRKEAAAVCQHQGTAAGSVDRRTVINTATGGREMPGPPVLRSQPGNKHTCRAYLRVMLGEEVAPRGRCRDAYEEYSLDREDTQDTVGLSADRHFPLNIQ